MRELMLLSAISIMLSTASNYIVRRRSFYAMCSALGLQRSDLCMIVRFLVQALASVSFLLSMLIAPVISSYITRFLEERFDGTMITTDVWDLDSLLIFAAMTCLLQLSVTVSLRSVRKLAVVDLLREEDE